MYFIKNNIYTIKTKHIEIKINCKNKKIEIPYQDLELYPINGFSIINVEDDIAITSCDCPELDYRNLVRHSVLHNDSKKQSNTNQIFKNIYYIDTSLYYSKTYINIDLISILTKTLFVVGNNREKYGYVKDCVYIYEDMIKNINKTLEIYEDYVDNKYKDRRLDI